MQDRIPKYPGRVKLTPVDEANHLYHMERADEPLVEGTPINKGTLLKDETAEILDLSADPTVDEALRKVAIGAVPTLRVTTQTGSTVTATMGSVVKTTLQKDGEWFFYLKPGTWTIRATLGEMSETQTLVVTEVKQYTLHLEYTKIYGAEWDGTSSPSWSRTDKAVGFKNPVPYVGEGGKGSSPFDDCYPWSAIRTVTDETLGSYVDRTYNSATMTFDGQMVEIPKFYYKWTRTGNRMKLQIAERKPEWRDDFLVSPAHADRGDGKGERDVVYIAKHKVALPYNASEFGRARTVAGNVGEGYHLFDFAMYWTIAMLYLVEFAHWNCQLKIGRGCGRDNGSVPVDLDEKAIYHTGTNAAARNEYHYYTKYRDIVGLWSNRLDFIDGIAFNGSSIYCSNTPGKLKIGTSSVTGGTLVGTRASTDGYITKWTNPTAKGYEYALFPAAANGSEGEYICDTHAYGSKACVLLMGGVGSAGTNDGYVTHGLFRLYGAIGPTSSTSNYNRGIRVMKLP